MFSSAKSYTRDDGSNSYPLSLAQFWDDLCVKLRTFLGPGWPWQVRPAVYSWSKGTWKARGPSGVNGKTETTLDIGNLRKSWTDGKQPPHWQWGHLACPRLLRALSDGVNPHWRCCLSLLDTRYFHTSASFPFIFHQPCAQRRSCSAVSHSPKSPSCHDGWTLQSSCSAPLGTSSGRCTWNFWRGKPLHSHLRLPKGLISLQNLSYIFKGDRPSVKQNPCQVPSILSLKWVSCWQTQILSLHAYR